MSTDKPKRDYTKGRGVFEDPIELKYVQIPRDVIVKLFIELSKIPEKSRFMALGYFCWHYLTNQGFEALKDKDIQAYILCEMMNQKTFVVQNNSRWKLFDEFYKGELTDFDAAMERHRQETKEKKRERNRLDYQRRKLGESINKTFDERQREIEAKEKDNLKEFIDKHEIDVDI